MGTLWTLPAQPGTTRPPDPRRDPGASRARSGQRGRPRPQGTSPRTALLIEVPQIAATSAVAYWKYTLAPDKPAGHDSQLSGIAPEPSVKIRNWKAIGTGTSVPHLKGAGVLASEMNRLESAEGAAPVSDSVPGEPVVNGPVPTRSGMPLTPARPPPRSFHGSDGVGTVYGPKTATLPELSVAVKVISAEVVPAGVGTAARNSAPPMRVAVPLPPLSAPSVLHT